jgi:hypothetical protein
LYDNRGDRGNRVGVVLARLVVVLPALYYYRLHLSVPFKRNVTVCLVAISSFGRSNYSIYSAINVCILMYIRLNIVISTLGKNPIFRTFRVIILDFVNVL